MSSEPDEVIGTSQADTSGYHQQIKNLATFAGGGMTLREFLEASPDIKDVDREIELIATEKHHENVRLRAILKDAEDAGLDEFGWDSFDWGREAWEAYERFREGLQNVDTEPDSGSS